MRGQEDRVRTLISQQAADWLVANRAGLVGEDQERFAAWLQASPVHVEEYLALATIARDLRRARAHAEHSVDAIVARARGRDDEVVHTLWPRIRAAVGGVPSRRWQAAIAMAAALGAVGLAVLMSWNLRPAGQPQATGSTTALHFETRHGEQQTRRLADDSVVNLNTDSAVTIQYSKAERLVRLTAGEAEFEVAHEPDRPFRVLTGSAEVVALGTKFDVRLRRDSVVLTVVQGRVGVRPTPASAKRGTAADAAQPAQFVEVGVDQQISVTGGEWPVVPAPVDARRTTAWLHRQLVFDHEPLERVAAEINRYAPKPIEIETLALRDLRISGVFATDDTAAFIAFLRSLEGVQVEVAATRVRVSRK